MNKLVFTVEFEIDIDHPNVRNREPYELWTDVALKKGFKFQLDSDGWDKEWTTKVTCVKKVIQPAKPTPRATEPKCDGYGYPNCCYRHSEIWMNTPG